MSKKLILILVLGLILLSGCAKVAREVTNEQDLRSNNQEQQTTAVVATTAATEPQPQDFVKAMASLNKDYLSGINTAESSQQVTEEPASFKESKAFFFCLN